MSLPSSACRLFAALLLLPPAAAQEPAFRELFPDADHDEAVPEPGAFLGWRLGARFTRHRDVLAYARAVAASSPRVTVETYGTTAGGRPLMLAAVGAPELHGRREALRARNRALRRGEGKLEGPVVVWLGFGIHGDEASTVEGGLLLLHHLAADRRPETEALLARALVLLDLCSNPDGRERFVHGVMDRRVGRPADAPWSYENTQPWPGGRVSHHLFDLNRDWFLQTQAVSRARARVFLRELPQVLVDLHEMGHERSYYFSAPPGPPVNQHVSASVRRGWRILGGSVGDLFDRRGWPYWTGDVYPGDYPGYGGVWPCFHGAAGFTFEQATSRGGRVRRRDSSVVTLRDALLRHAGAAWATVSGAAGHRRELLEACREHFDEQREAGRRDELPWFVLTPRHDPDRLRLLEETLTRNGIRTQTLEQGATLVARPLLGERHRSVTVPAGSVAVSSRQPARALVLALMDPDVDVDPKLVEEETERRREGRPGELYDVTSWNLPLLFGVECWRTGELPEQEARPPSPAGGKGAEAQDGPPVAWLASGGRLGSSALVAELLDAGVRVGVASFPFTLEGQAWPRGTLVVLADRNRDEDLARLLREKAATADALLRPAHTFRTADGHDLGSSRIRALRPRSVLVACGPGVSAYSFGAVRWLLSEAVPVSHTCVPLRRLAGRALQEADVLVLPHLGDRARLPDKERLQAFLQRGGILVALRGAAERLTAKDPGLLPLERLPAEKTPKVGAVPGAILGARLDTRHRLGWGLQEDLSVQSRARVWWKAPEEGSGVKVVASWRRADDTGPPLHRSGVLIPGQAELLSGAPLVVEVRKGRGRIRAFLEDPAFRGTSPGIWKLLLNAVLL